MFFHRLMHCVVLVESSALECTLLAQNSIEGLAVLLHNELTLPLRVCVTD